MTLRRILLAASAPELREALEPRLATQGCELICADHPVAALRRACELAPDVVLWGLTGPEAEARALGVARVLPECALVLLLDAHVEAGLGAPLLRAASDVLRMPATELEIGLTLRRAAERVRLRTALHRVSRELRESASEHPIVAASPAMIELLEALDRVSGQSAPVLIRGERGTGKEAIARALHAQSPRRGAPFVVMQCAAQDPDRIDTALFGTTPPANEIRRGRFVEADGGTLYLAAIDALSPRLQQRVLQTLREQQVASDPRGRPRRIDVRLLAGSARDLGACAAAGRFDGALLDGLGKLELQVPPLRERPEDLPLLVDHLLVRARRAIGRPIGIGDEALERLLAYPWPGNVRELHNVIHRALLRLRGDRITPLDLAGDLDSEVRARGERDLGLRAARRHTEIRMIREALRRTEGNRTHAATLLGISHRALLYKLKEYALRDV